MNNKILKRIIFCSMAMLLYSFATVSKLHTEEASPSQQVAELMGFGLYGRALSFINEKIKNNPNSAELYVARGAIYANTKRDSLSLSDQNKALELMEKDQAQNNSMIKANALYNRAAIYARRGNSQDAERDYVKAISIYPSDSISYFDLGKLQLKQKRYTEAKANLSKAKELLLKQSGIEEAAEADKLLKKIEKKLTR